MGDGEASAECAGYHRGFAHADMIPAEVRGKSCMPEIVKQDPSGVDVEWITLLFVLSL